MANTGQARQPGRTSSTKKRASLACRGCRQRKVKCDAQLLEAGQPCTPCLHSNARCEIDRDADRRRAGSRRHIESLQERIQMLESMIGHNLPQQEVPGPQADDTVETASQNGPAIAALAESSHLDFAFVAQGGPSSMGEHYPPADELLLDSLPDLQEEPSQQQSGAGQEREHALTSIGFNLEDLASGHVNGQIATGISSADPIDVEARSRRDPPGDHAMIDAAQQSPDSAFFGNTSQWHVRRCSQQSPATSSNNVFDGLEDHDGIGVAVDMDSPRLRQNLLGVFFEYQSLWLDVVDKAVFMKHRIESCPSQWYSRFLEHVLLACAARMSTSAAVRALAPAYAKKASADSMAALENPTAASLQGFIMLSEFEVREGNDRKGWMLCGVACRMISDLGLHQKMDASSTASEEAQSGLSEGNMFFHLLCACISYEGIWTLYLGRPSSIPKTIMSATAKECQKCTSQSMGLAVAWMRLCVPMAEVNDILNDPSPQYDARRRLLELDAQLQEWNESLPLGLSCAESNMADLDSTAYGVHAQYCKIKILIHGSAHITAGPENRTSSQSGMQNTGLSSSSPHSPTDIVFENAMKMARLLVTYQQMFGTEKISSIMIDNANLAATSIINRLLKKKMSESTTRLAKQWLKLIVDTLNAVQVHFPITLRMVQSLTQMVQHTPLEDVVYPHLSHSNPHLHPHPNPISTSTIIPITSPHRLDAMIIDTNISLQQDGTFNLADSRREHPHPHPNPGHQHYPLNPSSPPPPPTTDPTHPPKTLTALEQEWMHLNTTNLPASLLGWPSSHFTSSLLSPTYSGMV